MNTAMIGLTGGKMGQVPRAGKPYVVKFLTQNGMRGTAQTFSYQHAVSMWSKFRTAEIWFGQTKLR